MHARSLVTANALPVLLAALGLALGTGACTADRPTEPSTDARVSPAGSILGSYTVRDLGTLGGPWSRAWDINDRGVVVGESTTQTGARHAFRWQNGIMTDLRTITYGISSTAMAVNRYDVIVGWSELAWGATRAVRWMNGMRRNLGTLGGRDSKATDINNSGWIVGYSQTQNGQTHAFLWRDGVMTDLGTLGGSLSLATAINSEGVIVGYSTKEPGPLAKEFGFRWKDGVMRELPSMPGTAWAYMRPLAIRAGRIVGEGAPEEANGDWSNALIWESGVPTNLGQLGGDYARAADVNAAGLVVGTVHHNIPDCNVSEAFGWKDGQLGILPPLNGINKYAVATAINRTGLIVGFSETAAGSSDCELGDFHAALWTPN